MEKIKIIILAAGKGKRIKQKTIPKVLVPVNGRPMISHVLDAIKKALPHTTHTIIVGNEAQLVQKTLGSEYHYVLQKKQLGTGHAVACAKKSIKGKAKNILVLYGDKPFINAATIKSIINKHTRTQSVLTMATITVSNYKGWQRGFFDLGRIIRDEKGRIIKVVEQKDASPAERKIKELNPTYLCFNAVWLWNNISRIKNENAQGEYYLPDLIKMACEQKQKISSAKAKPIEGLGINTQKQLELAKKMIR